MVLYVKINSSSNVEVEGPQQKEVMLRYTVSVKNKKI